MTPSGRPKLPPEQRKTRRLIVRCTPGDELKIEELAAKHGLSVSEYVRRRALGKRITRL